MEAPSPESSNTSIQQLQEQIAIMKSEYEERIAQLESDQAATIELLQELLQAIETQRAQSSTTGDSGSQEEPRTNQTVDTTNMGYRLGQLFRRSADKLGEKVASVAPPELLSDKGKQIRDDTQHRS